MGEEGGGGGSGGGGGGGGGGLEDGRITQARKVCYFIGANFLLL